MRTTMFFTAFILSFPFAAAGQDRETQTLEQVRVAPTVSSRPISCEHQNWPSNAQIRRKLHLPADAAVNQMRSKAIKESRAICRQAYTHVQWHYRKAGQQVAFTVR